MLTRTAQGDTCRAAVGIASAAYFHTCIYYAYSYKWVRIYFSERLVVLGEAGCADILRMCRRGWVRRYFAYAGGAFGEAGCV